MSTLCNGAVLCLCKTIVSELCMLSMRHRPYSLIFNSLFALPFCFNLCSKGHPGVCHCQLSLLEIMLKHVGLTEMVFLVEVDVKYVALVNTISTGWLGHAILGEIKDQSQR